MTPAKAPLPFLGTWKLAKCETSHPDVPHPSGGITTMTQGKDAIHYTNDGVRSDGLTTKVTADLKLDGSWCPVTGSLIADSLSFRTREDGSFEAKMRKGGADVGSTHSTVSPDGRTLTGHWKLAGPGGAIITWTTTSERQ
jgi:hypothetical protein